MIRNSDYSSAMGQLVKELYKSRVIVNPNCVLVKIKDPSSGTVEDVPVHKIILDTYCPGSSWNIARMRDPIDGILDSLEAFVELMYFGETEKFVSTEEIDAFLGQLLGGNAFRFFNVSGEATGQISMKAEPQVPEFTFEAVAEPETTSDVEEIETVTNQPLQLQVTKEEPSYVDDWETGQPQIESFQSQAKPDLKFVKVTPKPPLAKIFGCAHCKFKTKNSQALSEHIKVSHPNLKVVKDLHGNLKVIEAVKVIAAPKIKSNLSCPKCQFLTKDAKGLYDHIKWKHPETKVNFVTSATAAKAVAAAPQAKPKVEESVLSPFEDSEEEEEIPKSKRRKHDSDDEDFHPNLSIGEKLKRIRGKPLPGSSIKLNVPGGSRGQSGMEKDLQMEKGELPDDIFDDIDDMIKGEPEGDEEDQDLGNVQVIDTGIQETITASTTPHPDVIAFGRKLKHVFNKDSQLGQVEALRKQYKSKDFRCITCDESFPRIELKTRHTNLLHPANPNEEKMFNCGNCFRAFGYLQTVKDHIKFKCTIRKVKSCGLCNCELAEGTNIKYHLKKDCPRKPNYFTYFALNSTEELARLRDNSLTCENCEVTFRDMQANQFVDHDCTINKTLEENYDENPLAKRVVVLPLEKAGTGLMTRRIADFDDMTEDEIQQLKTTGKLDDPNFELLTVAQRKELKQKAQRHTTPKQRLEYNSTKIPYDYTKQFVEYDEEKAGGRTRTLRIVPKCFPCDIKFNSPRDLYAHAQEKHEGKIKCLTCGEYQKTNQPLWRSFYNHQRTHGYSAKNDNSLVVCELCGRNVKKCNMGKHLLMHDGTKKKKRAEIPHKACEICGIMIKGKAHMRRHIRTVHEKKRPFECKFCDMRWGDGFNWRKHMKNHHGAEFYQKIPDGFLGCNKLFMRLPGEEEETVDKE